MFGGNRSSPSSRGRVCTVGSGGDPTTVGTAPSPAGSTRPVTMASPPSRSRASSAASHDRGDPAVVVRHRDERCPGLLAAPVGGVGDAGLGGTAGAVRPVPSVRSSATHAATSPPRLWSTTITSAGQVSPAAIERRHSRSSGRPTVGMTTVTSAATRRLVIHRAPPARRTGRPASPSRPAQPPGAARRLDPDTSPDGRCSSAARPPRTSRRGSPAPRTHPAGPATPRPAGRRTAARCRRPGSCAASSVETRSTTSAGLHPHPRGQRERQRRAGQVEPASGADQVLRPAPPDPAEPERHQRGQQQPGRREHPGDPCRGWLSSTGTLTQHDQQRRRRPPAARSRTRSGPPGRGQPAGRPEPAARPRRGRAPATLSGNAQRTASGMDSRPSPTAG